MPGGTRKPASSRLDVIGLIRAAEAGRDPARLALKHAHLRSGPEGFLRGTVHLYNARLPADGALYEAPPAWCCGDLHLENFGTFKADNRLVHFDINDFDDALRAPATTDLLRLLVSARVSAPRLGLSASDSAELAAGMLAHYAAAIVSRQALWIERETARGMIGELLEELRERPRAAFLDSRSEIRGKQRRLRLDGKKALPLHDGEREALQSFMADFAARQDAPAFFELIDAARRVSGNGSLGVARYVLLVRGKGGPGGNYLLDLKAAQASDLAGWLARRQQIGQPVWESEAQRVVSIQACMQANRIALLHAVRFDGRACVLRELQPAQDRVELASLRGRPKRLRALLLCQAELLAWAQLRASGHYGAACADALVEFVAAKRWRASLLRESARAAEAVLDDWQTYAQAYDAGAFEPERAGSAGRA